MQLKAGGRLKSAVCDTEVVVVRAPSGDVAVQCGGHDMVAQGTEPPAGVSLEPGQDTGTLLGKRYADEAVGIELLCTKAGKGSLGVNGQPLGLKEAKPLPSSD